MTRLVALLLSLLTVAATFAGAATAQPSAAAGDPQRLIVGLDTTSGLAPGDDLHGASVVALDRAARFVVVSAADAQAFRGRAAHDPHVRYVEDDTADAVALAVPNDPRVTDQWGRGPTPGIDAYGAWDVTWGSSSVVVAVIDSGVDLAHEDAPHLAQGWDFVSNDAAPEDDCGHGTHVAGTVGAATNNGRGVAGVAQATVLPVRVLSYKPDTARCSGYWSHVASGITWSADQGADIITMSLGCLGCASQAVSDALAYAWGRGALVIASAGNSGPCTDCVGFPASDPHAMAVTALQKDGKLAIFSSTGPQVELAAPGLAIWSTKPGDAYASMSGTSMAAPHVAGTAALVLSVAPMTNQQLRDHLKATAANAGLSASAQGAGALNAASAVNAALTVPPPVPGPAPNEPPAASFNASCTDLTCAFDGSASSDANGVVASHAWTFGDGAGATDSVVTHTYAAAGTYTVTLTVTDDAGAQGTATTTVTVTPPPASEPAPAAMAHVHDIQHASKGRNLFATIWVADAGETPLAGAPVSAEICRTGGPCERFTGTTAGDGSVSLKWSKVVGGTYTTCVTAIDASGYIWDADAGHAAQGNCATTRV